MTKERKLTQEQEMTIQELKMMHTHLTQTYLYLFKTLYAMKDYFTNKHQTTFLKDQMLPIIKDIKIINRGKQIDFNSLIHQIDPSEYPTAKNEKGVR